MRAQLTGMDKVRASIRKVQQTFPDRVLRALTIEGNIEMTEAKKRTPVDTGTLRASGRVDKPQRQGRRMFITLGFGGAAETYAFIVHEDMEAHHDVGQAKYLESTLNESAPFMAQRLARHLQLRAI